MGTVLKILVFPILILLPWTVMRLSNSEESFQSFITNQPALLIVILIPSIIIIIRWISKFLIG